MYGIQERLDEYLENFYSAGEYFSFVLKKELEEVGIQITDSQREKLKAQLSETDCSSFLLSIEDSQWQKAGFESEEAVSEKLREIIDRLPESIRKSLEGAEDHIRVSAEAAAEEAATALFDKLLSEAEGVNESALAESVALSESIANTWSEPLKLLQIIIKITEEISHDYHARNDLYVENSAVVDVLVRIHATAVRVSREVFTLLRYGYPDGALARWRTLHELAVIAAFLSDHGDDVAEKYINHQIVDIYKSAIQEKALNISPESVSEAEDVIEEVQVPYDKLLEQYGKEYRYDYGWAAGVLGVKKITFREIESHVEMKLFRAAYKSASSYVHSGPAGVFDSQGLLPGDNYFLSGQSNIGLGWPARNTIASLSILSTTLLSHGATVDSIIAGKLISKLSDEAYESFKAVEKKTHSFELK